MSKATKPLDLFWFIPVSGDGSYLRTLERGRPADFAYLKQIAQAVDRLGYKGVLIPTGRGGDDPWITAAALAPLTERLKFLVALRPMNVTSTLRSFFPSTLGSFRAGQSYFAELLTKSNHRCRVTLFHIPPS